MYRPSAIRKLLLTVVTAQIALFSLVGCSNLKTIEVYEDISVTDSQEVTSPAEILVTESISVSDVHGASSSVIGIMEYIGVSDLPIIAPAVEIMVAEIIGVADLPTYTLIRPPPVR